MGDVVGGGGGQSFLAVSNGFRFAINDLVDVFVGSQGFLAVGNGFQFQLNDLVDVFVGLLP